MLTSILELSPRGFTFSSRLCCRVLPTTIDQRQSPRSNWLSLLREGARRQQQGRNEFGRIYGLGSTVYSIRPGLGFAARLRAGGGHLGQAQILICADHGHHSMPPFVPRHTVSTVATARRWVHLLHAPLHTTQGLLNPLLLSCAQKSRVLSTMYLAHLCSAMGAEQNGNRTPRFPRCDELTNK